MSAGDTTDWTGFREFKSVALTASYVLSWHCEGASLVVDLDLCLQPDHAFYEPPRRAGRPCIRPALLEFPECTRLAPAAAAADLPVARAASTMGLGRIAGFRRVGEGRYRLFGEFGTVTIESGRPLLRLTGKLV